MQVKAGGGPAADSECLMEPALEYHAPESLEAAVVGIEEQGGLVKGFAFVVPRQPVDVPETLVDELTRHAERSLAPHQRPRAIRLVADLPRTATGKLQRFRLKEGVSRAP